MTTRLEPIMERPEAERQEAYGESPKVSGRYQRGCRVSVAGARPTARQLFNMKNSEIRRQASTVSSKEPTLHRLPETRSIRRWSSISRMAPSVPVTTSHNSLPSSSSGVASWAESATSASRKTSESSSDDKATAKSYTSHITHKSSTAGDFLDSQPNVEFLRIHWRVSHEEAIPVAKSMDKLPIHLTTKPDFTVSAPTALPPMATNSPAHAISKFNIKQKRVELVSIFEVDEEKLQCKRNYAHDCISAVSVVRFLSNPAADTTTLQELLTSQTRLPGLPQSTSLSPAFDNVTLNASTPKRKDAQSSFDLSSCEISSRSLDASLTKPIKRKSTTDLTSDTATPQPKKAELTIAKKFGKIRAKTRTHRRKTLGGIGVPATLLPLQNASSGFVDTDSTEPLTLFGGGACKANQSKTGGGRQGIRGLLERVESVKKHALNKFNREGQHLYFSNEEFVQCRVLDRRYFIQKQAKTAAPLFSTYHLPATQTHLSNAIRIELRVNSQNWTQQVEFYSRLFNITPATEDAETGTVCSFPLPMPNYNEKVEFSLIKLDRAQLDLSICRQAVTLELWVRASQALRNFVKTANNVKQCKNSRGYYKLKDLDGNILKLRTSGPTGFSRQSASSLGASISRQQSTASQNMSQIAFQSANSSKTCLNLSSRCGMQASRDIRRRSSTNIGSPLTGQSSKTPLIHPAVLQVTPKRRSSLLGGYRGSPSASRLDHVVAIYQNASPSTRKMAVV